MCRYWTITRGKNKLITHTHKPNHRSKKEKFKKFTLIPEPYIFNGGIAKELKSVLTVPRVASHPSLIPVPTLGEAQGHLLAEAHCRACTAQQAAADTRMKI